MAYCDNTSTRETAMLHAVSAPQTHWGTLVLVYLGGGAGSDVIQTLHHHYNRSFSRAVYKVRAREKVNVSVICLYVYFFLRWCASLI